MPSNIKKDDASTVAWLPDLIYTGGRFESELALVCDEAGRIERLARASELDATAKFEGEIVRLNITVAQRVSAGNTHHNNSSKPQRGDIYAVPDGTQEIIDNVCTHSSRYGLLITRP